MTKCPVNKSKKYYKNVIKNQSMFKFFLLKWKLTLFTGHISKCTSVWFGYMLHAACHFSSLMHANNECFSNQKWTQHDFICFSAKLSKCRFFMKTKLNWFITKGKENLYGFFEKMVSKFCHGIIIRKIEKNCFKSSWHRWNVLIQLRFHQSSHCS